MPLSTCFPIIQKQSILVCYVSVKSYLVSKAYPAALLLPGEKPDFGSRAETATRKCHCYKLSFSEVLQAPLFLSLCSFQHLVQLHNSRQEVQLTVEIALPCKKTFQLKLHIIHMSPTLLLVRTPETYLQTQDKPAEFCMTYRLDPISLRYIYTTSHHSDLRVVSASTMVSFNKTPQQNNRD